MANRLRNEEGQVALELLVTFFAWFITIILMMNVVLLLANMTLTQGTLTRVALETSSQGCLTADSAKQLTGYSGFGVTSKDVTLTVATEHSTTGSFTASKAKSTLGAANGDCRGSNGVSGVVPGPSSNGTTYIYLKMTYQQRFWGWPTPLTITHTALVVSHAQSENS